MVSSRDNTTQRAVPLLLLPCAATPGRPRAGGYSLIAPVEAGGDVALHILHPVMGQVAHQHLPSQVQDFVHDVPQPVEEVAFVPLGNTHRGRLSSQSPYGAVGKPQRKGRGTSRSPSVCLPLWGQILH